MIVPSISTEDPSGGTGARAVPTKLCKLPADGTDATLYTEEAELWDSGSHVRSSRHETLQLCQRFQPL